MAIYPRNSKAFWEAVVRSLCLHLPGLVPTFTTL